MTYSQIVKHYGTVRNVLAVLDGIGTVQAVYRWKRAGVPLPYQYELEVKSGGALKAERLSDAKAA